MTGQKDTTCRSEVELSTLAPGMAKQHERYQDALQELIDNAVSSVVINESYFEDPADSIKIVITIQRTEHAVRTTVADNGPGIEHGVLQNDIFRTGNRNASNGILNNVGWGLKASLAWFEKTLSQTEQTPDNSWFTLVTQTNKSSRYCVDGPITGDLPISTADEETWRGGLGIGDHDIDQQTSGTRVHVSCSRPQFDNDVWPSAKSLEIKAQTLREMLGVKFRRLLDAHPENEIYIDYRNKTNGSSGSLPVVPIFPQYVAEDDNPPTVHRSDIFEFEGDDGAVFEVEFERGTLDFEAMTNELADEYPGLFTTSGRFRTRYRPNQAKQGVDIYANGRILTTSVFTNLFDLIRNNEYNYFGGEVRIIPKDASDEVPTDNKKIRIDTNSTLWQKLRETLSSHQYQPEGKRYDDTNVASESSSSSIPTVSSSDSEVVANTVPSNDISESCSIDPSSLSTADDLFSLHQQDSRKIEEVVRDSGEIPDDGGIVDVTLTSPPYFNLKDYGYESEEQLGQSGSYDQYLEEIRKVFRQVYNVTQETGTLWVVANTFKNNGEIVQLPNDIATVCQNLPGKERCRKCDTLLKRDRLKHKLTCPDCDYSYERRDNSWLLQDIVIWNKNRALPYNSNGQFRNVFEYILCFSKSASYEFDVDKTRVADPKQFKQWWVEYPERYHPRGKVPDNIWDYVTPAQGSFGGIDSLDHPAPFPINLVERILRLTTEEDSIVLDPFAGSGTVPAVAGTMGRRSIGFELSPEYCDAYDDVKEEIEEKYGEQLQSRTTKQQEELAKVIGGLRQVKHVRELLREHARAENLSTHGDLSIHTIFHVCRNIDVEPMNDSRFVESNIYYIVDDDLGDKHRSNMRQSLQSIAKNGISSSYDINQRIHICSTSEFLEQTVTQSETASVDDLYVYQNGRHYDYTEKISLADWVERAVGTNQWQQSFAQQEWPPIVSNLGLSIDNPRRRTDYDSDESQTITRLEVLGVDELALI